jgi:hypothetical protein
MEASHECVHTRLAYRCLAAVLLKSARTHTCAEYKVRLNELVRDTLLKKVDCIFFARKKIVSRGGMMTSANTVHCTVRSSGGCGIASSFSPHPRVTSSSSMRKSSCNDCFRRSWERIPQFALSSALIFPRAGGSIHIVLESV